MNKFDNEYAQLNSQQKKAVDSTEGPLLVVAGPGTGKTQLLSMRVANILRKSGVGPGNILCLTFTDNAAREMRERLDGIIGQSAYHVSIQTFHSFGSDVLSHYPDFAKRQMLQQIDELGQYELMQGIFEQLPHSNPLSTKVGDQFVHLKSTLGVISWLKQNALAPHELHEILNANDKFMRTVAAELAETFGTIPSPKQLARYSQLLKKIQGLAMDKRIFGFPDYGAECAAELAEAIETTDANGRFAQPITVWRNRWCKKDAVGKYVFKDSGQSMRKMHAVANVYQKLQDQMSDQGLYDFDDMIVEAVHAMENNDELRYNLQERYQYVLVDEFQDTNKSQLRMLGCLGDNPVHENRPNIMAVGDDDQAIYAFQGALTSNMAVFLQMYDQPPPIILRENYRSNAAILETATVVADQISDRLESITPLAHKKLVAKQRYKTDILDHLSFASELAQYDHISVEIKKLIDGGSEPEQIAVIAPRHKYLERLMPYLGNQRIPVAYERRENILDAPIVVQLLAMSELVSAIAENRQDDVDALISQVLSYDFWDIPAETLLEISLSCYDKHKHWLDVLAKHKDKKVLAVTDWFIGLAKRSRLEPMEYMLDNLIGASEDGIDSEYDDLMMPKSQQSKFVSPLRKYYFSSENYEQATDGYLALLGQLATLRHRLRQWKPNRALYIKDFVEFWRLHEAANLKIADTNPHTQTTNAVRVMTAYKAKGLEFENVFIINAQDEVWGPTAKSRTSGISLPKNLPIEPAGNGDNDKLRLLFVAFTRAKHTLHITSYSHTQDNKPSPGLSFLMDGEEPLHPSLKPQHIDKPASVKSVEILSTDWAYRFRQIIADKQALFEPILKNYKLSVTHLNNFLDVKDGGPGYFFVHNLLRFPEALSPSAAYGAAVHETLQWTHNRLRQESKLPQPAAIKSYFADMLGRKHLRKADYKRLECRGQSALEHYFKKRGKALSAKDMAERGFNNEGVVINGASLSGKIDKLSFGEKGEVRVIDFKTGKPAQSWKGKDEYEKIKLHKYRQQMLFYKLLVENSASFAGKLSVAGGRVEFIEPDDTGQLADPLEIHFEPDEILRFAKLIGAVWGHLTQLKFPDTERYPKNLHGIQQFEDDLIEGNTV